MNWTFSILQTGRKHKTFSMPCSGPFFHIFCLVFTLSASPICSSCCLPQLWIQSFPSCTNSMDFSLEGCNNPAHNSQITWHDTRSCISDSIKCFFTLTCFSWAFSSHQLFYWCFFDVILLQCTKYGVKFLITPSIFLSIFSPNLTTFVVYYYRTMWSSVLSTSISLYLEKNPQIYPFAVCELSPVFLWRMRKKWILICALVIINFNFFSIFSISISSIFFFNFCFHLRLDDLRALLQP